MTTNKTGGLLAALAILLLSFSVSAQNDADSNRPSGRYQSSEERSFTYNIDQAGNVIERISAYVDDHHYKVAKEKGRIKSLYVDGRRIPADSMSAYEPVIAALEEQMKKDKEKSRQDVARAWKEKQEAEKDARLERLTKVQAEKNAYLDEKNKMQAERNAYLDEKNKIQAEKNAYQAELNKLEAEDGARKMRADRELMWSLIRELVGEKIIDNERELLWMALTDDKLIVNGKEQPESIHEKFRSQFITQPGYGIFYGDPKIPGKGLFFNKQDLNTVDL